MFNFLYGKEETQIIVSDNKDFVINNFLKQISSLYYDMKIDKIEINELKKGEILKLRLIYLLLLLNIIHPNTFNEKELNQNVEWTIKYNIITYLINVTIKNKNYQIKENFLLLLQDKELFKELIKSDENHDELYIWLYDLIERILKSHNYKFDKSYVRTLYKLSYEMENKNNLITQTQNQVNIELVLLNFLLQILPYLKTKNKELIKINERELKDRNSLYSPFRNILLFVYFIYFICIIIIIIIEIKRKFIINIFKKNIIIYIIYYIIWIVIFVLLIVTISSIIFIYKLEHEYRPDIMIKF